MIRAAQPLGACPGGRAPRQNWGKFEAHKWGGFTGRLDELVDSWAFSAMRFWVAALARPSISMMAMRR